MQLPYLVDRRSVSDADELMTRYGVEAPREAARRAGRSRDLGNHIHFCRWRQIERWIRSLSDEPSGGLIH